MAKQRTSHPRRRRRRLVLLFLLLAILAGELWWSNCTLSVESFTYVSSRLPAGFDGFRIVQSLRSPRGGVRRGQRRPFYPRWRRSSRT